MTQVHKEYCKPENMGSFAKEAYNRVHFYLRQGEAKSMTKEQMPRRDDNVCEAIDKLLFDHPADAYTKVYLARCVTMPPKCACGILEKFANHGYGQEVGWNLRATVAANESLPSECACSLLNHLHNDKYQAVRSAVERNPLWKNCQKR